MLSYGYHARSDQPNGGRRRRSNPAISPLTSWIVLWKLDKLLKPPHNAGLCPRGILKYSKPLPRRGRSQREQSQASKYFPKDNKMQFEKFLARTMNVKQNLASLIVRLLDLKVESFLFQWKVLNIRDIKNDQNYNYIYTIFKKHWLFMKT